LSTEVNRAPRKAFESATRPMVGLPQGDSPFLNSSYTNTAGIEVHEGGTEGTIPTPGDRFADCGFYLLKGNPVFFGVISTSSASNGKPRMRLRGEHTLEFELKSDGHHTLAFNNFSGIRRSATGTLTHYRSLENL